MLTDRFPEALTFAEGLHRSQTRKGNDIPYVAHLLAVTATVLEWGGDEDTAIAALLHDAAEDQGGEATLQLIRARFGDRVADLVLHCTDSLAADPEAKAPWLERKTAYLERLRHADPAAALITVADKLHNISATLRDVRVHGSRTLGRFAEPQLVSWYFRSVADAMSPHASTAPVAELEAAVAGLDALLEDPAQPKWQRFEPPPIEDDPTCGYPAWVRAEINETMQEMEPGTWGELGICPGPYGCPYPTTEEAIAAGVEEHFCSSCRVVHLYRPPSPATKPC